MTDGRADDGFMSIFPPPSDVKVEPSPTTAMASSPRGLGRWPLWAKIATPVVALLVAGGIAGTVTGSNRDPVVPPATQPAASVKPLAEVTDTKAVVVASIVPATVASTTPPTAAPTSAATVPPTAAPTVPAAPAPVATPAPVVTPAPTQPPAQPATDPRFGTCKEAKANGYGPYVRGQDPEYNWYRDGDNDGVVCE